MPAAGGTRSAGPPAARPNASSRSPGTEEAQKQTTSGILSRSAKVESNNRWGTQTSLFHQPGKYTMPDPDRLLTTLRRAIQACHDTPGRLGRTVRLDEAAEVLATGDL